MKHLLKVSDLGKSEITRLLQLAYQYQNGERCFGMVPRNTILATLFFEPSTRTRLSFEVAMHRLGGRVISASELATTSCEKGESLEDTVRIVSESYADVIVLRHPEKDAVARAADFSSAPIINGGDGAGEHPTQALCDLYALWDAFNGNLEDKSVVIFGDVDNSRAAHSFATILETMGVGVQLMKYNQRRNYLWADASAIYVTRPQLERMEDDLDLDFYNNRARSTIKVMARSKIMHPLPRTGEISRELDKDPRSIYFKQAKAGVPIRTVVLAHLLDIVQL